MRTAVKTCSRLTNEYEWKRHVFGTNTHKHTQDTHTYSEPIEWSDESVRQKETHSRKLCACVHMRLLYIYFLGYVFNEHYDRQT